MKVFVIRDGVFTLNNGTPASNLLHYAAFPKRYLAAFSHVTMVGRLFEKEDPTARPVTGKDVDFVALPGYHGPVGFLRSLPRVLRILFTTIDRRSAYILRIPTTVPSLYCFVLHFRRIPFAVEVAADPYDGYSPQALGNHPLSPLFRWLFVRLVRWQCRTAVAAAYVTRDALQRRYPARDAESSFSFTSIDLTPEAYVEAPRKFALAPSQGIAHVSLIGNMQKALKGHDVFLKAVAQLKAGGMRIRATIIGYGENLESFRTMARELGIGDDVEFTGKLENGAPIRAVLDQSDLFVLPSRQEGLPRALLEAMARALPAIATRVGGTPELVGEEGLVEVDDVNGLAQRMHQFLSDPELLSEQSAFNLERARSYRVDIVTEERQRFYEKIIAEVTRRYRGGRI